jgi:hypothetical protein
MSNNPNDDFNQQNFSSFGSFGQFNQSENPKLDTHWGFAPPAAEASTAPEEENKEESPQTASISSGFDTFIKSPQVESKTGIDSDSFLAEPSMTAAEFDSTFIKESREDELESAVGSESPSAEPEIIEPSPEPEVIFPAEPAETICMTSPDTIPQLIEEAEKTPQYLESPQSTTIEDAVVNSAFPDDLNESDFEVIDSSEIFESAQAVAVPETPKTKKVASIAQTPKVSKAETPKVSKAETPKVSKAETPKPAKTETAKAQTPKTKTPKITKAKSPAQSPVKAKISDSVEGSRHSTRQRATVQRLESVPVALKKETSTEVTIQSGPGTRLGDIESIAKAVNGKVAAHAQLILLHRVLFDRMGEATKRKANIRAFCGVEGSQEAFETKLKKYTAADIKNLAALLSLPVTGDKAALSARVAAFLAKPSGEACVKSAAATKKATKPAKPKLTNRTAAVKRKNSQESLTEEPVKKSKTVGTKAASKVKTAAKSKKAKAESSVKSLLTPDTVESDVDSDIEREVLEEIQNSETP